MTQICSPFVCLSINLGPISLSSCILMYSSKMA